MGNNLQSQTATKCRLFAAVTFVSAVVVGSPFARADPVAINFNWTTFASVVEPPNSVPAGVFVATDLATHSLHPEQGVPFSLPISAVNDAVDFYTATPSPNTHNQAFFIANPSIDVRVGSLFRFGNFYVVNGSWFGQANLTFTMTTVSSNPDLNGHSLTDTLRMDQNPFVLKDPAAGADTFSLVDLRRRTCGTVTIGDATCEPGVRVYELFDSPVLPRVDGVSNYGSFELWGRIGSLISTELRNVQGAAFVEPIPSAVPEPSEILLMLTGLAGTALFVKRGRRARVR